MYQFTTNTIINSAVDASNPDVAKYKSLSLPDGTLAFRVSKVGLYKKANIVRISKKSYSAGVKEQATLVVPAVAAGTVIRLELDIRLSQQTYGDYASTYLYFKKPVVVEIIATNNATNDAASLAVEINKLYDRFGHSYVNASATTGTITFTAKDDNQRFYKITLSKEEASSNSIIQPEYSSLATGTVTVGGALGFGDDDWMVRRVMLPTAENTRYFGISKEERPILGGNYTQYVINYSIDKEDDGIVAGHKSITNHVFWVPASLVSGFESELDNLGLPIGISVAATGGIVSLDTSDNASVQLIVTNSVGALTFVSSVPANATVNSTGLVTTGGVTGVGDTVITVTDSVGNSASITITVVA